MNQTGFSRLEVVILVVTLFVVVLVGVVANRVTRPRKAAIPCESRLKELGLAFLNYASDHDRRFPMNLLTNSHDAEVLGAGVAQYFRMLEGMLASPERLICPKDNRSPAASWSQLAPTNISYFLGLGADINLRSSILAGDRNVTNHPSSAFLNGPIQWRQSTGLHGNVGNILFADGRVETVTSGRLRDIVESVSNAKNPFLTP
jgi:prepilin-type processing-associated H-X9-DG protein